MADKVYICPNCNENTLHNSADGFICDSCEHKFTSEYTEYGGVKFTDITRDSDEIVSESLIVEDADEYYSKVYDALRDTVDEMNSYFNAVGNNIEDYLNKKGFYKVNDTLYMKQDNYNDSTYTSYIDFIDSSANINAYVKVNDKLIESYEMISKSLNEASISDMLDELELKGKDNWTDSDWELFNHIDATKGKYEEVDEESEEEEILTEDFADELKAIAKKYCKEKGYEFLFANDYKFGFEIPDTHQMWTMTYDELKDDLENNPINEDYESGNGLSASANEIYNYIKNVYGFKDVIADSVSLLNACRVLIQDAVNQYIIDYGVPSQTLEDYMNKTEFELLAHMLVGDLMEDSVITEDIDDGVFRIILTRADNGEKERLEFNNIDEPLDYIAKLKRDNDDFFTSAILIDSDYVVRAAWAYDDSITEDFDTKFSDKYFPRVNVEDKSRYSDIYNFKKQNFIYDKKDNLVLLIYKDEEELAELGENTPWREIDVVGLRAENWDNEEIRNEYLSNYLDDLREEGEYWAVEAKKEFGITEAVEEEVVDEEEAEEEIEEPVEEKSNDFYLKIAFAETSGAPSDDLIAEASEKEFNDINDLNRLLKLADSEFRDYWAQNGGVFGYDKVYIDGYYKIGDDTYKVDTIRRVDLGDGKYGDNYIIVTEADVENGRRLAKNTADNISDGYGKVTLVKENVVKKVVKESVVNMQGNPIDKIVFGKYRVLVEKDYIVDKYVYSVVGYKSMLAISRKTFDSLEEAVKFFDKIKAKINKVAGCDDLDFVTCLEDNYEEVDKIVLSIGKIDRKV